MAKAQRKAASTIAHVEAVLEEIRLFSERAQVVDAGASDGQSVTASISATANVGVAIVDGPNDKKRLLINHAYKVVITKQGSGEKVCEYESDYRAAFAVKNLVGIDLSKPIPIPPVETYISQVNWAARTRVLGTFLQMGMSGITVPNLPSYQEQPARGAS